MAKPYGSGTVTSRAVKFLPLLVSNIWWQKTEKGVEHWEPHCELHSRCSNFGTQKQIQRLLLSPRVLHNCTLPISFWLLQSICPDPDGPILPFVSQSHPQAPPSHPESKECFIVWPLQWRKTIPSYRLVWCCVPDLAEFLSLADVYRNESMIYKDPLLSLLEEEQIFAICLCCSNFMW